MTAEARKNLQLGVPEDKRFSNTDYTSDGSTLDNYLLSIAKIRKQSMDQYNSKKAQEQQKKDEAIAEKQLEAEIQKKASTAIEKTVDNIFKNWK